MDASFRTSSRRSYDLPKPDADLADWTSKIKAIQRQVDAEEVDEPKKLEEEIAAARQARLRRSRGGGTPSRADSADLCMCSHHIPCSPSFIVVISQQAASSLGCSVTPRTPPIKIPQSR
jgi:hypothetical protein